MLTAAAAASLPGARHPASSAAPSPAHFHRQLPGMSGDSSSFFGPPPPSSATAHSSLMAPMESDMVVDVIGDREKSPSLYNYLFDIFGERLGLRLAGHRKFVAQPSSPHRPPQSKSAHESSTAEDETRKPPPPSDHKLLAFLNREGFRPVRIDAHRQIPPPPHTYRGHGVGLSLPRTVLPGQRNVLEERHTKRRKHKGYHSRVHPSLGQFTGRTRGSNKHGKSKSICANIYISDINSSWL